jgi:UDP-GlcNAc:undecaprenyl-phosphate GlcNAc-1-phosphate transferase
MFSLIYIALTGTIFVSIFVVLLHPLAVIAKLVDKPNARKHHQGDIPLLGGPVIWLVSFISFLVVPDLLSPMLMAIASALVILGIIDDRFNISAIFRLVCQLAAAFTAILTLDLNIHDFGIFTLPTETDYKHFVTLVSALAVVAAINAFNFIDGIDGLSASLAAIGFVHVNLAFGLLAHPTPPDILAIIMLVLGSLSGFLLFNLRVFSGRKIFLGDSGSMFLGFFTAFVLIRASQGNVTISSATIPAGLCLWIIAIPITDLMTVTSRRMLAGRSPMSPDRAHLHHILLDNGLSGRRTLVMLLMSAIGMFWLGYLIFYWFGEIACTLAFFPTAIGYYYAILKSGKLLQADQKLTNAD